MSEVRQKLPRIAVRDSFDDDDTSDVDDEVFIQDGKHGILKIDDDCGLKRPLMAPRKKSKIAHFSDSSQIPIRTLVAPLCYTLLGLAVIMGLITACVVTRLEFPSSLTGIKHWLYPLADKTFEKPHVVPCTSLRSTKLWTRTFPKLSSEAPLKSNDVNQDGIEDIIVGFSTGRNTKFHE